MQNMGHMTTFFSLALSGVGIANISLYGIV
jgi:hypothetical protein